MAETIQPGDLITLECPNGSVPMGRAGARMGQDPKSPVAVIVRIEGSKIIVGSFKTGELGFSLDCSNGQKAQASVNLPATPPDKLPERENPLGPIGIAFPLWFWIALAVALLTIALSLRAVYQRLTRRTPSRIKMPPPPPLAPDEALRRFIGEGEKARSWENPQGIRALYSSGNDLLRAYLSFRLGFAAESATTSEYIGSLKAAVQTRQAHAAKHVGTVELLLTQADQVRFAREEPETEARRFFFDGIKKIFEEQEQRARASAAAAATQAGTAIGRAGRDM